MDILIKNMEMPINCCFCLFKLFSTCILKERIKTKGYHDRKRHPKCPLVPIPEHGDLIDRDAFIKEHEDGFVEQIMKGGDAIGRRIIPMHDIARALNAAEVVLERTT